MTFQNFRMTFRDYPLFSTKEIKMFYPKFDSKNLVNWQEKNYIQKIRNSWYRLTEKPLDSDTLFFISNQMYAPSYISLESALSYYGFIPEGVFKITAVSTLKTQEFNTSVGFFSYRNIKPSLNFGYQLVTFDRFSFKIAEPEKTILDFLYLSPDHNTDDHFFELRWNVLELKRQINFEKLTDYQTFINSKALSKRVKVLLNFIENA